MLIVWDKSKHNLDTNKNSYTIKEKHFAKIPLWNFKRGAIGFYDLDLKHIRAEYRYEIRKQLILGRSILIEIENKKRILIFNKK